MREKRPLGPSQAGGGMGAERLGWSAKDGMGAGLVEDALFWGAVSLMILGVLVGLLALMLVEDARKAMGERRYGQGHLRI